MTRRLVLLAAFALFIASAASALAHDQYRIIGTIAKVTTKSLDIKQAKDGKVIGMDMTEATLVTRDKKKVAVTQLKVGLSVVADAIGDSLEELEAVEVKIVPSP